VLHGTSIGEIKTQVFLQIKGCLTFLHMHHIHIHHDLRNQSRILGLNFIFLS